MIVMRNSYESVCIGYVQSYPTYLINQTKEASNRVLCNIRNYVILICNAANELLGFVEFE